MGKLGGPQAGLLPERRPQVATTVGLGPTVGAVAQNRAARKQHVILITQKTQKPLFERLRQESVQFEQLGKLLKTAQTLRPCRAQNLRKLLKTAQRQESVQFEQLRGLFY